MPQIISSTVLRNNYNEISKRCKTCPEPIYVTKNGNGDLAVMGIEGYEMLQSRLEFYEFLMQGKRDVEAGKIMPAADASAAIRQELGL